MANRKAKKKSLKKLDKDHMRLKCNDKDNEPLVKKSASDLDIKAPAHQIIKDSNNTTDNNNKNNIKINSRSHTTNSSSDDDSSSDSSFESDDQVDELPNKQHQSTQIVRS